MSTFSTEDLFAAARGDAPSSAVHDAVWDRVVDTTTAPCPASSTAPAASAATSAGSLKLLAIGALASGVAISALLASATPPGESPPAHRLPAVVMTGHVAGARLADPAPRGRTPVVPRAALPAASTEPSRSHDASAGAAPEESSLAEEARLVTEARSALVRGEPERALVLARGARRLATPKLEPEELGVEARALRALGRTDESLATELTLKRRFPDHALAR